ncbi:MAG: UbiH/UbiF/VisC/COQ6 family ubiquinone biosynthesis hydroxylase, partial [Pseudomonadales bacterium]|nr:UbiH/UbiF/VisC/COQ6 family ubiquinone biosynthesis hydroxylase [Pseudomonadales bacterium]
MNNHLSYDIVIIGAGIAGSALACKLDGSALKVLLIEAGNATAVSLAASDSVDDFDPRVSALTQASQAFLQNIGVWPAMLQQRVTAFQHMHVFDGEGSGQISFSAADVAAEQLGHIVENRVIVSSLQQKLQFSTNVRLQHNARINHMARCEKGYRLTMEDGAQIETHLLVAADGANSWVRQQAQFKTREWDYQQKAIVCTVSCDSSHQHTAWQCFTEHGPLAFLPLQDQQTDGHFYASIVWSLDTAAAEQMMQLGETEFMQALTTGIEQRCGNVTSVSQRFCFPLRQRHAINYTKPHLALIGDAAHTIHPLAGQGINLGIKDAAVLAEE